MRRTCNAEDWEFSGANRSAFLEGKTPCGLTYDDVDHSTICPHEYLPPPLVISEQVRKLPPPTMHILYTTAQDDALRELLSYCRTHAENDTVIRNASQRALYREIANRLAKILDGEA